MSTAYDTRLGHVGLFVVDLPLMVDFYTHVLGFAVTDVGDGGSPTFLSRSADDHHQVVLVKGRQPGGPDMVQQLSFNIGSLEEVQTVFRRIRDSNATELRTITHGIAWSVYFRDPEGNRLEMFADTDWYITQPFSTPIDLDKPAASLHLEIERMCKSRPDFKPMTQWKAEFADKMRSSGP